MSRPYSLAICAALFLAACSETSALAQPQEIFDGSGTIEPARGIWHSAEYGWSLDIDADGITRWQDTPAGCYASAQDGPTLMSQVEYRYITPLGTDRAKFEYLPSDGNTVFERLDALPLELVEIPEGLRRVPHPAEALVPFMEDELELDRAMSGQQVGATAGGEQ